ncbi:hypothetical protein HUW51_18670 [Adhaeribacter swui]|uniref:Polysaccharide chain length determinant N-terminal domain-containing protein n=1 Tax=Adhaeribacter swui TaxID=2086471 RepID=A0A7G7GBW8_9BACT|nr:hypothetical protein [Adhaeribacter swui]QNF34652.1 hypothetical protein HUW51_18670 [Adhaeribacter swui]
MASSEFNLNKFLPLMQQWRWPLAGVTLAGFLVSVITALLLPDIYRSTAIFYPTNLPALQTTLNPEYTTQERLALSMSTDDADRLISIGQSQPVLKHIIQKFKLAEHYGYPAHDTSDKIRQKVTEEFLYNYNIYQNNRSAVEVSFDDQNNFFAARMANAIMQQIDTVNQQLTRSNQFKILDAYAQRELVLRQELKQMQDSLLLTRQQYNIFGSMSAEAEGRPESRFLAERLVQTETDLQQAQGTLQSYKSQLPANHTKIITLTAEIKGLQAALKALKSKSAGSSINLESYLAGSDRIARLENAFKALQEEHQKARQTYAEAQLTLKNGTTSLYLVQPATPALKKIRPIRWLIVVGSTLVTFVLSVVVITLLERRRSLQHQAFYA